MIYLAILLVVFGFSALCLSMNRHYSQLFKERRPNPTRLNILRYSGYLALLPSIVCCTSIWGLGTGLVYWFMLACLVVILISALLPLIDQSDTAK